MQTEEQIAWANQRQRQFEQQAYYTQQAAKHYPTLTGFTSQQQGQTALAPALPVSQQDQPPMKQSNGHASNKSSTTQGSEGEEEAPVLENGEPVPKRTLQNRKAQREFRQRRAAHLKDLEERVRKYEAGHHEVNIDLQRQVMALRDENDYLRGLLARLGHEVEQPRAASYQPYPLPSMPASMPTTPLRSSCAYPNSARMSLGLSRHSHSPPATRTPSVGSARSRRGLDSEATQHPSHASYYHQQQQQMPQQMQEAYPQAAPAMRQVSGHHQQQAWGVQASSLTSLLSAVDSQRTDLDDPSPNSAGLQSRRSSQTTASPLWPQQDYPHHPPGHPPPQFQQSPVIYQPQQAHYDALPPIRQQTEEYGHMMPAIGAMQHHHPPQQEYHSQPRVQQPAPVEMMDAPSEDDDEKDANWTPDCER